MRECDASAVSSRERDLIAFGTSSTLIVAAMSSSGSDLRQLHLTLQLSVQVSALAKLSAITRPYFTVSMVRFSSSVSRGPFSNIPRLNAIGSPLMR